MKLYVWNDPYQVIYGGSCLYVIANNLREARKLAATKCADASYGGFNRKDMKSCKVDVSKMEPTSIHELPHAECYHWEE